MPPSSSSQDQLSFRDSKPMNQTQQSSQTETDEILLFSTPNPKEDLSNQCAEQDLFNESTLKSSTIPQPQSPNSPTSFPQEWSMNFETPEKPSNAISSKVSSLSENFQQIASLQSEIQQWKDKYEEKVQANAAIQKTLEQYCNTMSGIAEQIKTLQDENASLIVDNESLRQQLALEQGKNEQVSMECSVLRRKEEAMDGSIASLQPELLNAQKKYDLIKSHAEERLEAANQELQRLQTGYDSEIGLLKVKLSKHELKIKSLEGVIEMKTKENHELMSICDDLIQKMDNAK